jgi:hypothetical protein
MPWWTTSLHGQAVLWASHGLSTTFTAPSCFSWNIVLDCARAIDHLGIERVFALDQYPSNIDYFGIRPLRQAGEEIKRFDCVEIEAFHDDPLT